MASSTKFYFMSLLDTIKTTLPGATKDQQKFSQKNVPEKAKVWQRLAEVVQNARSSLPPEELKVFDAILDPTTKIMPTLSCLPQQTTSISSTVATVKPSWGLKAYSSDAIAATPALDSASSSSISDTSSVKGVPASSVTSGSTSVDIPAVWDSLPAIFEHDSTRSTPPKSSTGESGHTGPHASPGVTKELIKYMQDAFEPPGSFDVAKDLNLLRYELPKRTGFQDLQKAVFDEQIPVARQCLGLSRSLTTEQNTKVTPDRLKDAVLVCIDFENGPSIVENPKSTKLYSQMGVCIFDARVLSSRSDFDPERVLETYNFSTRNTQKWRDQLFIFGKTEETTLKGLYSKLDELLDRSRNNILIGHDVEHEIAVINALGFDIDARFSAILDTQDMMKWLWLPEKYKQVKYPPRHVLDVRLESLLSRIGVEFADLHVGGNDANFTLKAFLLLVVESLRRDKYEQREKEFDEKRRAGLLKEIGMAKLPLRIPQNSVTRGSSGLSLGVVRTGQKPTNAKSPAKVCYRPVTPFHRWEQQIRKTSMTSKEPIVMLEAPLPFEPLNVGRLEHEQRLSSCSELDWARNEAMGQIGFGEVLSPSVAWWRHQEGEK